jgi:hypothetical protein
VVAKRPAVYGILGRVVDPKTVELARVGDGVRRTLNIFLGGKAGRGKKELLWDQRRRITGETEERWAGAAVAHHVIPKICSQRASIV